LVATEWACLMMAILVFNPQTNTRHFVLTLLPMALAVATLRKPVPRIPWRLALAGAVVLFAGLTLPPGNRRIPWLLELHNRWFPFGGPCWLILASLGLLLIAGLMAARAMMNSAGPGDASNRVRT
jgi:hypothetical protein